MKKLLLLAVLLFGTRAHAVINPVFPTDWNAHLIGQVQYASITFTATAASATGIVIVAAHSGQTVVVLGWSVSTDTAGRITLHHQSGAATRSNTASNIFGGGLFAANGGERGNPGLCWLPGLAVNQPVCADVSGAMTNVEICVAYGVY